MGVEAGKGLFAKLFFILLWQNRREGNLRAFYTEMEGSFRLFDSLSSRTCI